MKENVQNLLMTAFKYHQKGELKLAEDLYIKLLKIQPLHFDALQLYGLIVAEKGQYKLAQSLMEKALSINPNDIKVNNNLGLTYSRMGIYPKAIQYFSKSIEIEPKYLEALYNRGMAFQAINELQLAKNDYENALNINPNNISVLINLGNLLQEKKNFQKALILYEKVIKLDPNNYHAFNNRGHLKYSLQKYSEALSDFDMAIHINSKYADAFSNRGMTLQILGQTEAALNDYNKAILINKQFIQALQNRANLLCEIGRIDEGLRDLKNIYDLNPKFPYLKGTMLATKLRVCDWKNFDFEKREIEELIQNEEKVSQPFWIIPIVNSAILQKKVAQDWCKTNYGHIYRNKIKIKKDLKRKIKIGYFSADFHNHATMYLIAKLFELHDREKFEIYGFSFGKRYPDEMWQKANAHLDNFFDVSKKTDFEVSTLARNINIDIGIDLKGYTLHCRPGIFAHGVAPIQINYLGYPGTMAAPFIDYIIADHILVPKENNDFYTEKIIYMPNSYQANDDSRQISQKQFKREDFGIPNNCFVFCCFNNNYKINPDIFNSWVKILKNVQNSILWLLEDNETAKTNLLREGRMRGVDLNRIIFAKRIPHAEHLARHKLADLFLDTFPCNAHTTASDSLWSGLPVLTIKGDTFASRVAASLLSNLGLDYLITKNNVEYENLAILLGNNQNRLTELKSVLDKNLKTSPLYDSKKFTLDLEEKYLELINQ